MSKTLPIKTLKLSQLLERWPHFSLENIYELADQAYFGLYIKPHRERKTSYDIQKYIENLIKKEPGNEYYRESMQSFDNFILNNPLLIENKAGYVRLPTSSEVKIFPHCAASSIQRLNQCKRIEFYEYNNTFGIIKENDRYVCHSFLLQASSLTGQYPKDYKDHISKEELFVFIEQIEHCERSMAFETYNTSFLIKNKSSKKSKGPRPPFAWRTKTKDIFNQDKIKNNSQIWNVLRTLAEEGDEVIIDVTSWGATNAHLVWKSPSTGKEISVKRRAFQTFMSTLRRPELRPTH